MAVLVYIRYVKVTRMTKTENSGIQTGICGNLVYERYVNKKSRMKSYTNLFFAVIIANKIG